MNTLRWMRVPGDMMSAGAAVFAWFVLGPLTGHSFKMRQSQPDHLRIQMG